MPFVDAIKISLQTIRVSGWLTLEGREEERKDGGRRGKGGGGRESEGREERRRVARETERGETAEVEMERERERYKRLPAVFIFIHLQNNRSLNRLVNLLLGKAVTYSFFFTAL